MHKIWHDTAWEDYLYWQTQDKKTLKRINKLLTDIVDIPFKKCTLFGILVHPYPV